MRSCSGEGEGADLVVEDQGEGVAGDGVPGVGVFEGAVVSEAEGGIAGEGGCVEGFRKEGGEEDQDVG